MGVFSPSAVLPRLPDGNHPSDRAAAGPAAFDIDGRDACGHHFFRLKSPVPIRRNPCRLRRPLGHVVAFVDRLDRVPSPSFVGGAEGFTGKTLTMEKGNEP